MVRNGKISKFLRKKRVEAGLTQQQVARVLGYSSSQFVSNWERGLCNPPMESLGQLVTLFKIDNEEIMEIYLDSMRDQLRQVLPKQNRAR
jgi:transcriptional regulator with XRE-family HTH domain